MPEMKQKLTVARFCLDGRLECEEAQAALWTLDELTEALGWVRFPMGPGGGRLFHQQASSQKTHSNAFPQEIYHVYGTA